MKKRLISFTLVMSILLSLVVVFPNSANAATSGTCGANLTWKFDSDTLTISGYGKMNNYSSTSYPWYSLRASIKNVSIEKGVKSIGDYAFYKCSSLTSIVIPNSVTSIGEWTFSSCSRLTNITIPNSVTSIGRDAFYYCSSLANITIPNSVTSIGKSAFADCSNLTNITISNNVTTIGEYTFLNCGLTNITIPNSITNIGEAAFLGCKNSTSITIPSSVKRIDRRAFESCINLTNIIIPDSVETIGDSAFRGCHSLTDIIIPSNVTSIGASAFAACENLTNISVNKNNNYFSSLNGNLYNKNKTKLLQYAIGKTETYFKIPSGIKYIEVDAFFKANNLTSIMMPSSIVSIGDCAFNTCNNLKDVYYTGSVDDWNEVEKGNFNYGITKATIHYNHGTVGVKQTNTTHIGNNVINQLNSMLSSVTICDERIKGPTFNLLNKYTFCPIDFPAKAVIDLSKFSKCITIDEEKKTVHVIVGKVNENKEATVVRTTKMCDSSWSKQYKEYKDMFNTKNWNGFEKMKGQLNRMGCDMFIKGSMECLAYLDFNYQTGYLQFEKGGIMQSASLGADFDFSVAGPLFASLGIKGAEKGAIELVRNQYGGVDPQMSITPSITAKASMKGKAGELGEVEVGVDTTLGVTLQTMDPNLEVFLGGSIFLTARALSWKLVDWRRPFADVELYPEFKANEVRTMSLASLGTKTVYAEAVPIPRDYLYGISLCSLGTEAAIYEQNSVYIDNDAQLLRLPGSSMMLVWTGDDGTKSDNNRTSLMYSIYKDGVWSETRKIAEDGTATGYFKAVSDGNTAYIVFQKMNEVLSEDITLEEMLQKTDLYMVRYENGEFSESINLTEYEDFAYEYITDVDMQDNNLIITWTENSENDIFVASGTSTSKMITITDGAIGDVEVIGEFAGENGEYQTNICIADDGGVYYIESVAVNEQTTSQMYCYKDGASERIMDADGISNIRFSDGVMYYIKNASVYKYEDNTEAAIEIDGVDSFDIISNGEYCSMLMSVSDGAKSEIYISNLEDGEWSHKERFTDLGEYVRSYSPFMYDDGTINLAVSVAQVNDEDEEATTMYGTTSMLVLNQCEYFDISSNYVYYDDNEVIPGGNVNLYFDISNDSAKDVGLVNVEISDENGTVLYEQAVTCDVKAFSSGEAYVTYRLPDSISKTKINLKITADGEEKDYSNNTVETEYGYADVCIANTSYVVNDDNTADITARITNSGYENAENVVVKVYNGSKTGDVLEEVSVGALAVGEEYVLEYTFPAELMVSPNADALNAVYVVVETDAIENKSANNEEKITFNSFEREYTVSNVVAENGKATVTITNNYGDGAKMFVVSYSETGQMLEMKPVDIDIAVGESNDIEVDIKTDDVCRISAYVWDENYALRPLSDRFDQTL